MLKPDPLRVVRHQEVVAMMRGEPGSLAFEDVREHGMLMDVGHEDAALLRSRKRIRLIDAGAAVRRAMTMIGDGLDVAVDIRIEVLSALALVDAARDRRATGAG